MNELRIIIAGTRTFENYTLLSEEINNYIGTLFEVKAIDQDTKITIISGGARGADRLAERYAKEKGYNLKIFPADWNTYGKSAGYRRNAEMAKFAAENRKGVLIAFWDAESKGTKNMIDVAKRYELDVIEIRYIDWSNSEC